MARLTTVGGSPAVRIPKLILNISGWAIGDMIDLHWVASEDALVIKNVTTMLKKMQDRQEGKLREIAKSV